MIYDRTSSQVCLAMLCNNPAILYNPRFKLSRKDFQPLLFHYYLFSAIEKIAESGAEEIDANAISVFLHSTEKYKAQLQVLEDNDYQEFISSYKEVVRDSDRSFDFYYDNIRKYSLVREYKEQGFNIDEIYNETKDEAEQKQRLNDFNIEEILNYFEVKQVKIKGEYSKESPIEESWVGTNTKELIDMFKESPSFGCCLNSPYFTTVGAGWSKGHLVLASSPSGFSKTAQAIGNLCLVCAKEIWDVKQHKFVPNPQYQGAGFYIHTEQKQWEEVQPRFLSYLSNVECYSIMRGELTRDEEERVVRAGEILMESKIRLINLPNFTMTSIRDTIKSMVLKYKCTYGVFDYIFDNTSCMQEYKAKVGNATRQDMMFLAVATELKAIAEEYNIGLMSMTQLNGKEKTIKIVDESCIYGSTQMKNKIDSGVISMSPKKEELDLIEPLISGKGFDINMVSNVYKSRYNKYGKALRIWQNVNKSTGRVIDYFCTDVDNKPIQIDRTELKGVSLV